MNTAKLLKDNLEGWTGHAQLYELFPPYMNGRKKCQFVAVSATSALYSGRETYIFRTTKSGVVKDWSELPGSYKGGLNHERALNGLGYEVKK